MLHKDYLRNHKPVVFSTLLAQGKLWQYLAVVDSQAQQMLNMLVEQMKEREGVSEQLKDENQFEWVRRMIDIENRAKEIVNQGMITL